MSLQFFYGQNIYLFCKHIMIFMIGMTLSLITMYAHSSGSIQLQYLQDSSETEDIFLDLNTDLTEKVSLFAGIGKTQSPTNTTDLGLDYWNLGLGFKLTRNFDIELEAGNFGQGRDINVDTIDMQLRWSSDNWAFSLKPQYDEIEVLVTNPVTNNQRIRSFDSTGIGASLDYYGIENWEFGVSYDTYDYSINTRALSIPFVIASISSKALIVTSGLRDNVLATDITYLLEETDARFSYIRSTSAIDQTVSDIFILAFDFYQYLPYKFGVEMGSVGSEIDDASYYGGFTAGYTW